MPTINSKIPFGTAEFQAVVDRRRQVRMAEIDRLPVATRQLVHTYGWNTVKAFLDTGVSKPRHIRHLVETVLNEFSPTRGATSTQGIHRAEGIGSNNPLCGNN